VTGARRRIVVMDDSQASLEVVSAILAEAGYQVDVASTLAELVSAVDRPVDLVLMDVDMPDVDGGELALTLRRIRGLTARILLYSALDEKELAVRAQSAEADGFLSKSSGAEAMLARIAELLGGGPRS
jgi:DNA-binding response OmpR family regulator